MPKFKIDDRASIIFENQLYDSLTLKLKLNSIINLFNNNVIDEKKPIGIAMERTPDLIMAMFAVLCYGVPFVPIDLSLPLERINFIISNSKIDFILTSKQGSTMLIEKNLLIINDIIDNDLKYELKNPQNEIAYLLYTSGSTGNPKGAEITRGALLNFIESISEIIDFSPGKRIACLTTVSFDIFFLESITAIYKGLTVVLANEDEQRNPKLMAKLIKDNKVDMIQMTPSRIQLLLNHDKGLSCLKDVREIMIGGESFPLSLLRTLKERTTAKIYNMYGPTETTIWSTVSDLTHKDCIDIGHAIKDTEIYIVDDSLSILPNGQVGEICIAGKGLAKGYVSRDDLTAEKFIHLPQKPDVRVYRTGDMGRYLSDGNLECLGRTDNQVKIRGHRIELEEIESYLNQVDGINQSVVIALETSETDKILEAFYTSDITLDQGNIADYLSSKLPDYMIPVIFKHVESFIQTANGKIDRKRVLECVEIKAEDSSIEDSDTAGLSDIQKRAFDVIATNLDSKIGDVTLETAFAGVGVDSITFITIVVALEGEFDFEFDDEKLLITEFPTIKSMVEYVESKVQ